MNFVLRKTSSLDAVIVAIKVKPESHLVWIRTFGLELASTGYPQPDIDYNHRDQPIVVGIDMV